MRAKVGHKKIAVAMSGGIDSTMAAVLLQEMGYEVLGVTMQLFPQKKQEVFDKIKQKLAFPLKVIDLQDVFAEKVVAYFQEEYLKGRTPNPCVACNRHLKFAALLEKVLSEGCDYLATGHYVRGAYDFKEERYALYRGRDRQKDQTYFLYNLTQRQLAHSLFPLGEYYKAELWAKAKQLGLAELFQSESQDLCFIKENNYRKFLAQQLRPGTWQPGKFVNQAGEILGEHQGLPFYTVGQRKGLGLAGDYPLYVLALNPEENTVVLGPEAALFQSSLEALDNNFLVALKPGESWGGQVQIRSGAKPAEAFLTWQAPRVQVVFKEAQRAITPGQSVVYYQGERLIGGGIIAKRDG